MRDILRITDYSTRPLKSTWKFKMKQSEITFSRYTKFMYCNQYLSHKVDKLQKKSNNIRFKLQQTQAEENKLVTEQGQ